MSNWHPRTQLVRLAQIDIERAVLEVAERNGLTYVETMQGLARAMESFSKHALRSERHPDDPDKGADEP
ncbi:hypothetical protein [Pseudoxanthomonas sp. SE1]|uniref:hypothetical protein n=1 Tax=Pseudoxanthomonas sp. SE1 TaxID=1664560 RepID=UPI00240DB16D|nr:hypothetical protein [Pseudoxanthomonas sp. SE1]WFC43215.1 hypothetical protein OY559_06815 [Pseudoxanthomonas sp. SE1]